MKLKDQVAVVTGAGRNIGEEIAKLFAAEGAKVAIVDVDKPRGERVVGAIKGSGGEAELFTADVSKGSDVAALVRSVVERFGRIDILVNNVAISDNKHIFDITEEEWDRVLAVTLKSQFLMGKHVAQQMAAQGTGGRIVNIGSTSGFMGRSRAVAYSAAKGGVANLTRAMAAQLAPHKIRVNAIVPNKIGSPVGKDEFDPARPVPNMVKRPGQPLEAAKAVLFLASDDLHVLERPSEGDPVPFLERIGGARAHQQGRAQLAEIDAGGLGQPPRFDQAHGIDPEQQVVHGLTDLAVADLAEMGIVGAKAAVDRASALDHVGLAANEGEQRSFIGSEAAPADWRVEDGDTACLRALLERLDGVGLGRRGHRDDRARGKSSEQPVRPEHDLIDFVVIADADDHEIGRVRDLGRRLGGGGAGIARLGQLLIVDVTSGHLIAVLDEMLEHRKSHAADADDAHALLLSVCHACPYAP